MKKNFTLSIILLLVSFLFGTSVFSQVGIGTSTPDASSVLDVTSTTQGMLTPRMTTIQRTAIGSPADGLIVYDTNLKSFYYYNFTTTSWIVLNSGANGRLNFKRIKSTDVLATVLAAEKAAGGANYKLDLNTYYEINGTVVFDAPIELNNAYLVGLDANEDKLIRSGSLFVGSTGGTVKNLAISTSGSVFALSGTGNVENLIFRDCIVAGCASVGSIENFGLVFFSVVQYVSNTTGITYNNITRLLLNNTAWFGNNTGTFEKFTGNFSLIQKQGGFCEVNGSAIGVDVSTSGLAITGDAVMETVVFTGSNPSGYVKGYTTGSYLGYNFNNSWNVRCAGIPTEVDASASGNLYDASNTGGPRTTVTTINTGYKLVTNATTASNLFRFTSPSSGRLTYKGKKTRTFEVSSSISFIESTLGGATNAIYLFYIAKRGSNGITVTPLPETETYIDTNSGFAQAFPVTGTVTLAVDESVEVWVKRINSGTKINIDTYSFNLSMR